MVTIIHGDDIVSSRNYFLSQKNEDSITFDAETLSPIELNQSLQREELFENSKSVFIENLFSRKAAKNLSATTEILKNKTSANVFIWADKILSAKQLSIFPKVNVKVFKIPQNIWAFLDGIRPMNPNSISLFHQAAKSNEPEIIFAMIVRQFRLMLGLAQPSKENIDEVKRLAPWQRNKLTRQSSLFGIEKLKKVYKNLYKIDKSIKTGKLSLTLMQSIDILLLDL